MENAENTRGKLREWYGAKKLQTCREEHNAVVVVETFTSLLHSINFDTQKFLKKYPQ